MRNKVKTLAPIQKLVDLQTAKIKLAAGKTVVIPDEAAGSEHVADCRSESVVMTGLGNTNRPTAKARPDGSPSSRRAGGRGTGPSSPRSAVKVGGLKISDAAKHIDPAYILGGYSQATQIAGVRTLAGLGAIRKHIKSCSRNQRPRIT